MGAGPAVDVDLSFSDVVDILDSGIIDGSKKGLQKNSDGSVDVYVGPKAPAGKESNWIQSAPGKGWNTILRLYGPLDPWFDKTWKPGDFELVK